MDDMPHRGQGQRIEQAVTDELPVRLGYEVVSVIDPRQKGDLVGEALVCQLRGLRDEQPGRRRDGALGRREDGGIRRPSGANRQR